MAGHLMLLALVLAGPCAGLLAVAALALLHEDLGRWRQLPHVSHRIATRRASAGLLRAYLEDAGGAAGLTGPTGGADYICAAEYTGAAPPWWRRLHRTPMAAVARRADAWILEEYLAERRRAPAPPPVPGPAAQPPARPSRAARFAALSA
jgi:hypothetical protein